MLATNDSLIIPVLTKKFLPDIEVLVQRTATILILISFSNLK